MWRLLSLIGALLMLPAVTSPAADVELRGVAWAGLHRAPNVIVWLDAPGAIPPPSRPVVLDQRNLAFSPQVLAVRVGTAVTFPNNDRVFHNVFSFRDGKRFDLGVYPVGASRTITFDRPGLSRIFCNIHPNMAAYVLALESAFFAVSDAEGVFRLPSLPPGPYPFHAWRAGAPQLAGSVTLGAEAPFDVR